MNNFNLTVKYYSINSHKIKDYDVLFHRMDDVKKLKKKSLNKAEFAEALKRELVWRFWSKAEWELIVTKTDEGRVILSPWCGCSDPDSVSIDVTDDSSFDWIRFANENIRKQIFKNEAKIDVYDQIMYGDRFSKLVDELWHTKLPYERDNEKFYKD